MWSLGLLAGRAASGGVAADRVAGGRQGAVQVLALDLAGDNRPGRSGSQGQAALADRAGLSGSQAGTGARPLRRTGLARLSSSRHLVHYGFLVRERSLSPLTSPS